MQQTALQLMEVVQLQVRNQVNQHVSDLEPRGALSLYMSNITQAELGMTF